jgi:hypothetical protein
MEEDGDFSTCRYSRGGCRLHCYNMRHAMASLLVKSNEGNRAEAEVKVFLERTVPERQVGTKEKFIMPTTYQQLWLR